jgi:hypothetical protein
MHCLKLILIIGNQLNILMVRVSSALNCYNRSSTLACLQYVQVLFYFTCVIFSDIGLWNERYQYLNMNYAHQKNSDMSTYAKGFF